MLTTSGAWLTRTSVCAVLLFAPLCRYGHVQQGGRADDGKIQPPLLQLKNSSYVAFRPARPVNVWSEILSLTDTYLRRRDWFGFSITVVLIVAV